MNESKSEAPETEVHTEVAVESVSEVVKTYNEEIAVDNSAVYAARLERLSNFIVTGTDENIAAAKKVRASLNALAKDAAASRMAVQRAIKMHPIGAFAFEKSELEKRIEKEAKRLGDDIARAVNAPKVQLNENVDTFVCFITGTLAQVNRLAVYANEQGLNFENRGPAFPPENEINAQAKGELI